MLELLQTKERDKILDIGSGSGWTVALLAYLVTKKGSVLGLEPIDGLVAFGQKNIAKYKYPNDQIQKADPKILDAPDKAPFDKILISASSTKAPLELLDQLKQNGRMLAPVKNSLILFEKTTDKIRSYEFLGFSFVPLIKSD